MSSDQNIDDKAIGEGNLSKDVSERGAPPFADKLYADESEPLGAPPQVGTAGGPGVSKQGGGTNSSQQGGNISSKG